MQNRMKKHQLNTEQIENLLHKAKTASLGTVNTDMTPYVVPIHFVYFDNHIYFHGLPKGQKIDNIKANQNVSFSAYELDCLLFDENENPCDTNTKYQSVIVTGTAKLLTDIEKKRLVLSEIVRKYTPHLSDKSLPENMVKGTAVVQIDIFEITGKYYK